MTIGRDDSGEIPALRAETIVPPEVRQCWSPVIFPSLKDKTRAACTAA